MLSVNHLERELEFNGLGVPEEQSLTPVYVIGSKTRKNGKRKGVLRRRLQRAEMPKLQKKSIIKQKKPLQDPNTKNDSVAKKQLVEHKSKQRRHTSAITTQTTRHNRAFQKRRPRLHFRELTNTRQYIVSDHQKHLNWTVQDNTKAFPPSAASANGK